MIEPELVKKNFSRAPDYYHKNAEIQRYVANKLTGIIQKKACKKIENILEIGCGTGFLTEKLFSLFPMAKFTISDISSPMLQFCKNQTQALRSKNKISADFLLNDIAKTSPDGKFDLIVSSLTLQWINDLSAILQQIRKHLSENGMIIFATLSQGTFASVKKVFNDLNIPFPGPQLLSVQEIKSACGHFSKIETTNEQRVENFDSMLLFLRHIQKTGAGNASGRPLPFKDLKKIIEQYHQEKVAEYNITYVVCTR